MQAEGFEKYFNKGNGKYESNDNDLSEVVVRDANKGNSDGVSFCHISVPGFIEQIICLDNEMITLN